MPEYRNILYEKQRQGILTTLNRPEVMNTISDELNHELHTALEEADADPQVRAIVLTGTGRAFSTGYDIQGGGQGDFVSPYGLPEGKSVAEVIDAWRNRAWNVEDGV